MKPSKSIETMDVYASESQYVNGPTKAQQAAGTVPLDTLPADWWNWLWKEITSRINEAASDEQSVYQEVLSVLTEAKISPDSLQTDQLLKAIQALIRRPGTAGTAGTVKSSSDSGKVSIDPNGVMTPNGMGVPTSLNTTAKNIVNAINEVLASFNSYKTSNDAAVNGLGTSKAPNNHSSTATTYGTGTSTKYGHVKLSSATNGTEGESDGVAATPAAVATVQAAVDALNTALTLPAGVTVPYAGDTPPVGWLLCNGQAVSRTDYPRLFAAIGLTYGSGNGSTTFNVPDLRECNPVGIGKRTSGVTNHNEFVLGGFQDDQTAKHNHDISAAGTTGNATPTFAGTQATLSLTNSTTGNESSHTHSYSHTHGYTPSGTIGDHKHSLSLAMDGTFESSHQIYGPVLDTTYRTGRGTTISGWRKESRDYFLRLGYSITGSTSFSTLACDMYTGTNQLSFTGTTGTTTSQSATTSGAGSSHNHSMNHSHTYTPAGSVETHSHTIPKATGDSGVSSGGTHGKLLGMNYIIKT